MTHSRDNEVLFIYFFLNSLENSNMNLGIGVTNKLKLLPIGLVLGDTATYIITHPYSTTTF